MPSVQRPEKVAVERVERTSGRVLSATQTTEAGVTRLACLARPVQRSSAEDRLASVLFPVRTRRRQAEKVELQGGRCAGHGDPLLPRSCARSLLIEVQCAGSGQSCEVEHDLRPGTDGHA